MLWHYALAIVSSRSISLDFEIIVLAAIWM